MPLFRRASPTCVLCRDRAAPEGACPPCLTALAPGPPEHEGLNALYWYRGPVASAVRRVKYGGDVAGAGALSRLLAASLPRAGLVEVDAVTFVPAHWRRRLTRGLNLPEHLAAGVSAALQRPMVDLLVNARHLPPLAGMSARERNEVVAGRFRPRRGWRRPRRVLLVDDVITTGATIRAAASALESMGIRCECLALARTPASRRAEG